MTKGTLGALLHAAAEMSSKASWKNFPAEPHGAEKPVASP